MKDADGRDVAAREPPATPANTAVATTVTATRTSTTLAPTASATEQGGGGRRWNTKNLGWRLGADAASAVSAAALIAPVITIIDRSIMENASGRRTLSASLRTSVRELLVRPARLLLSRPFGLIFLLYGGTYLTANAVDTAASTASSSSSSPRLLPASHVTSGPAKFAASSAANVALCIYKDQAFARLFGPPGLPPRPVPLPTYCLFALRDCLTIFASFNLPPLLGPWLDGHIAGYYGRRASEAAAAATGMRAVVGGATLAQFAAPAMVQLLSTPVHLLGLDFYNRARVDGGARDRLRRVARDWGVSTLARMCRILPAFGVGGVVNTKVRKVLMERLE